MSIWLRYLAIAVLIGNTFAAMSDSIVVRRALQHGPSNVNDLLALKLALAFAAITLAALIAAPGDREISLLAKLLAVAAAIGGGFGVLSSAMGLRTLMSLSSADPLPSAQDTYFVGSFVVEHFVQGAFFSLCTVALAIWVLAVRRVSAS